MGTVQGFDCGLQPVRVGEDNGCGVVCDCDCDDGREERDNFADVRLGTVCSQVGEKCRRVRVRVPIPPNTELNFNTFYSFFLPRVDLMNILWRLLTASLASDVY